MPRLKIQASVQQTSLSYSDNDVNIVLRVRETGLYGWRAECPEKKTTKQPEQWGNIQQAEGIKKLKYGQLGRFAKVITIYCVGGGVVVGGAR